MFDSNFQSVFYRVNSDRNRKTNINRRGTLKSKMILVQVVKASGFRLVYSRMFSNDSVLKGFV